MSDPVWQTAPDVSHALTDEGITVGDKMVRFCTALHFRMTSYSTAHAYVIYTYTQTSVYAISGYK
jgi:hypothetical protein